MGHVVSIETKRKLSESNMGHQTSEETKRKMSESHKKNPTRYWLGKKRSQEDVEKFRISHLGKKASEETRAKISKAKMGHIGWNKGLTKEEYPQLGNAGGKRGFHRREATKQKISRARKGQPNGRFGTKHSEETKKKIGESIKALGRIGENSPNWKGGITPENVSIRHSIEYHLWREAVFARDNYICQKCQAGGEKLHAHHIQNFADYPEVRFAIDNGITLCKKCHKEFHDKYGRRRNTREQLEEFLQL